MGMQNREVTGCGDQSLGVPRVESTMAETVAQLSDYRQSAGETDRAVSEQVEHEACLAKGTVLGGGPFPVNVCRLLK